MIRWIASYPKSGNTWVRLFLLAYQDSDSFDPNLRPPNFRQCVDTSTYEKVSPVPVDQLTEAEVYTLRGAVLVHLLRASGDLPLYLKTHCANINLDGTALIPPTLTDRALYLLRDPRDVVVSLADHMGVSIDEAIAQMVNEQIFLSRNIKLNQLISSWSLNVRSWMRKMDKMPIFCLRYEDLSADPVQWFKKVLEFFQVDFDPWRFQKALDLTTFEALRQAEDQNGYQTKSIKQSRFFRKGIVGGWSDVLTIDQVQRIEADHGKVMKTTGYDRKWPSLVASSTH